MSFAQKFDYCRDFGDIFQLVKDAAERSLGRRRAGLMLYLADLPLNVGAFHAFGTNGIVMNKRVLSIVAKSARSLQEVKAYVYYILLHEYLHALGYLDERVVRQLTYEVVRKNFGEGHVVTQMAERGPTDFFPEIVQHESYSTWLSDYVEIVSGFDKSVRRYIG